MSVESTPKVCIIGAGFSGICAAIQLRKQLGLKTFTIFDSNEDVGGTWLVNKYPGCACDVPSHLYSYSFEKNPDWSLNYASQQEIWYYIRKVAQKYDLYPHARFNTDIKVLKWDAGIKKWRVTVEDRSGKKKQRQELLFDIVINGAGILRIPNFPEEFKAFKGPTIHAAEWDSTIPLENKTVAIVGSGASAVQIIPSIAPKVKTLHVYQRKAAWVIPRQQFEYSRAVKFLFAYVPFLLLLFRAAIFFTFELLHNMFLYKSYFNSFAVWLAKVHRNMSVKNDPKLVEQLTPNYTFGCKRMAPSSDYYPALARSNVKLHTEGIQRVTGNSIISKDGKEQKLDVLVLATGFKYQDFFAPMEVYGKGGDNILELWKQSGPQTYYGIVQSKLPNHFFLLGPNTSLGHNSVVFQAECQVNFTVAVIKELIARKAGSATVKVRSEQEFMRTIKKDMKKTVWGNVECGSWYADEKGEITALWPKTCTSYWNETRKVDFNAFEFA